MKTQSHSSLLLVALLFGLAPLPSARAQYPTADDFDPGVDGAVYSLALQADGKVLVGGDFTTLGGQPRNCIGRLKADGTLDTGFNPGASGGFYNTKVSSLAVQPDGKILVGGDFTTLGGQPRDRIGQLNADGTLDTGFDPGAGGTVLSLAVQADSKILVGGSFSTLGGQPRNFLGRLHADGTLDAGFNPGANDPVASLTVLADGKILVSGTFTTLGGQPRNFLGRLHANGTLDAAFDAGVRKFGVTYGSVYSLAVQADGKILVGGDFDYLGYYLPRRKFGRLNPDGTVDTGFVTDDPGSPPYSLAVQADGKILVGGNFTTLGGQPRNRIGRLNATAPAPQSLTADASTITWLRGGTSPEVLRTTFAHSPDGTAWTDLGAGIRIAGGWRRTGLSLPPGGTIRARGYLTGGQYDSSSWYVEARTGPPILHAQPNSRTNNAFTTASFSVHAAGSEPLSYQWHKDGVALEDGPNIAGALTPTLTLSQVLQQDAGGYNVVVTNAQGSVTSGVASLTVIDPAIIGQPASQKASLGQSVTFSVTTVGTEPLAYQWWKDGAAVAQGTGASLTLDNLQGTDAGVYTVVVNNQYGSVTSAPALLTINLATVDAGFDPGSSGTVDSLAIQPDGRILVGGGFTTLAGQPRNHMGRLLANGTLDTGFDPGADSSVLSLAVQADGKILVGGGFTTLGGQPRDYLGRLNADGTLDTGFDPGAGSSVRSLAVQADGKILVGGLFMTLGGQPRNHIGRLNADGTLDTGFDPGADSTVTLLAVQADGKILVGGSFSTLGGQPRWRIGRLNADGTPDLGFDPGFVSSLSTLAVQADGKILVGGGFTTLGGQPRSRIARLNADGTLDAAFDPGAVGTVLSLAVQADGKILVGGMFMTLGGQPRSRIGRLNNAGPATESLTADASTITWLRGGTGPEVWRTSFAHSPDGTAWTDLGAGTRIPGGWERTGLSLPSGGTIRARGHVTSGQYSGSSWFVEASIGTPVMRTQPTSRTNDASTTAWFNAYVGGSEPLSCQWYKDGVALVDGPHITGALTPTLILSTVLKSDEGGYHVVVTNAHGSVTSAVATLTVIDPAITGQPVSQTAYAGASVTLRVTAGGTEPLSCQWYKDGVPLADGPNIAGALTPTLILSAVLGSDAGGYHVVVTNTQGSVTSVVAILTVTDPVILVPPFSQIADAGQSVTFDVIAEGTEPLSCQWYKDGVALVDGPHITGALTPTLSLSNVLRCDAGGYFLVVTNAHGSVTSAVATLTVTVWEELLHITNSPWRYWDQGDQGTAWRAPGFDDSGWPTGVGLFGYETNPGQYQYPFNTFIPSTGSSPAGPTTVYYRAHFQWPYGPRGAVLTGTSFIDDGAVFYLNGVEVGRHLISAYPVLFDTQPHSASPEGQALVLVFSPDSLVTGDNVVAVEVHQYGTSSDDVFGMTLLGSPDDRLNLSLSLVRDGSEVVLDWTGGQGPYQVQQTTTLGPTPTWENVGEPLHATSMRIPIGPGNVFLRVRGQ